MTKNELRLVSNNGLFEYPVVQLARWRYDGTGPSSYLRSLAKAVSDWSPFGVEADGGGVLLVALNADAAPGADFTCLRTGDSRTEFQELAASSRPSIDVAFPLEDLVDRQAPFTGPCTMALLQSPAVVPAFYGNADTQASMVAHLHAVPVPVSAVAAEGRGRVAVCVAAGGASLKAGAELLRIADASGDLELAVPEAFRPAARKMVGGRGKRSPNLLVVAEAAAKGLLLRGLFDKSEGYRPPE